MDGARERADCKEGVEVDGASERAECADGLFAASGCSILKAACARDVFCAIAKGIGGASPGDLCVGEKGRPSLLLEEEEVVVVVAASLPESKSRWTSARRRGGGSGEAVERCCLGIETGYDACGGVGSERERGRERRGGGEEKEEQGRRE